MAIDGGMMVSGGRSAVDCALRPQSVAVIGVSQAPGSAGQNAIRNLLASGYSRALHVVARGGGTFEGVASVPTIEDLPAENRSRRPRPFPPPRCSTRCKGAARAGSASR